MADELPHARLRIDNILRLNAVLVLTALALTSISSAADEVRPATSQATSRRDLPHAYIPPPPPPTPVNVVYIVDPSPSMADDFDGVIEFLCNSISTLRSEQHAFHVMFCSQGEPLEMPAKKLVEATINNKEQAGKFITGAKIASEKTDYAAAFEKACQVLDEANNRKSARSLIIFLASGDFKDDQKVLDVIKKYKETSNPIIYAYEYGLVVKAAQESLTKIAHDRDEGQYKLVPRNVSFATVRLPVDAKSDVVSLVVSSKKNQILFVASKGEGANATISSMAIDVATDEKTDLKKLIPALPADWTVWPGPVSRDGTPLLRAKPSKLPFRGDSLYLQSGVKIADDCRLIGWLGEKIAYQAWGDGPVKPICIYDPKEKTTQELPSTDFAVAADPRGKFILARRTQDKAATMIVLDETGKKLREFDFPATSDSQLLISPNGKYFATRFVPDAGKDSELRIASIDGKEAWTLQCSAMPVAVLSDGRLLVLENTSDHHVKSMSLYDSQGRQTDLGKVQAATIGRYWQDKIYFATVEERPGVKSMQIPAVKP